MTNEISTHCGRKPSVEWETPQELFDLLDTEYHFTLDPCATPLNAQCAKFYTKDQDGLGRSWAGERVFMNCPYGAETPRWVQKACEEFLTHATLVVCLIVPRTDTRWWHDYARRASEIRLLKGRVRFKNPGNPADRPQDPSTVVIFDPDHHCPANPDLVFWDWKAEVARVRS